MAKLKKSKQVEAEKPVVVEKVIQSKSEKEKKTKKRKETFSSFIYKLLKQRAPGIGITSKSMLIMNSLLVDLLESLSSEAGRLTLLSKKNVLTHNDVRAAVKLLMPGELAREALSDGHKALKMYSESL